MDAPSDTPKKKNKKVIQLTSHASSSSHGSKPTPIKWGATDPMERGPIIGTVTDMKHRNVIGTHSGAYGIYRALAVAAGALKPEHRADLTNTAPTTTIGPFPQWKEPKRIASIDPWGAVVTDVFKDYYAKGFDIRPSIAITQAHLTMPEIAQAMTAGRLKEDGKVLLALGECVVTKVAFEPVWYLPEIAARFGTDEPNLRRALFEQTAGMFPELVTRGDLEVFLPPIGGQTAYLFGDVSKLQTQDAHVTARVHDECNGSDVFGSDICTCRPYLAHGVEECIRDAQKGGVGVIVYYRKEGRALGEVTKFLVYNARKRQAGGDTASGYFQRTECVAGVQDMRFQVLMPDVLNWFGLKRIDRLVSMSNMKYDAIVGSGIEVGERVKIPKELVPKDAQVEMDAKMAAGYFTEAIPDVVELTKAKGRTLT